VFTSTVRVWNAWFWKAMVRPSGDHAAETSAPLSDVTRRSLPVTMSRT
jgi:hypothetical protein